MPRKMGPLLLILLLNPSCTDAARNEKQASPGWSQISIALPTEPPTLDWNLATDNVAFQILNQLMEGLTQYDDNLNPIPAIAESWEVTDSGHTYTFHLNRNYRWSDGKTVRAQDFRYSWLRLLNPATAAEYAYFLFDIKGAREFNEGIIKDESRVGIEVIDDATLKVRLDKPIVFFPSITTFMVTFPLRQDVVEKYGDRWTEPSNSVTCGPFQLEEWWHEYRLTLKQNPYFGGHPKPSISKLTIFLVSDPSTALSLYERGNLDVAIPPPIALDRYREHAELMSRPKLRGYYYGFNILKPPFDDRRVRQALAYSLDKREIPNILKGGEIPIDSWIPPGMFGFDGGIGLKYNPQKARQFLREAGYTKTNPFPEVNLHFNSDAVNKKIAEWAQGQWKRHLRISVKLQNEEWKSYLSTLRTDPPAIFRLGWGADYPDPDNFMNLFTRFSGNNHTRWASESFDQLIRRGAFEANLKKRKEIYDEAQRIFLEDETVIIPLFVATQNVLVKPHLNPYPITAMDFVYYKRVRMEQP